MKVYKCIKRFLATPLKRYIPVDACICRWENIAKLVINNAPASDDLFTILYNGQEYDNPSDVTWFYGVEPEGASNEFFILTGEFPEDECGDVITGGGSGVQGVQGPAGSGFQGAQGNDGSAGIDGLQGNDGSDGTDGTQGSQGDIGVGVQGDAGDTGSQGFQGDDGIGPQGPQGIQGLPGGVQGFQGQIGPQGNIGDTGSQGNQGNVGIDGLQGNQGLVGDTGLQGNQGSAGADGLQGNQGNDGSDGVQGFQGVTGPESAAGNDTEIQVNDGGVLGAHSGFKVVESFPNLLAEIHAGLAGLAGWNFYGSAGFLEGTILYNEDTDTLIIKASNDANFDLETSQTQPLVIRGVSKVDTDNLMTLVNTGTNGGSVNFYITDRTPLSNISAPPGSIAFREDGVNSELYIHKGSTTDSSSWETFIHTGSGQVGPQGVQGPEGNAGTNGTDGLQGFQGNVGFQGVVGNNGSDGATGVQGTTGLGTQGFQGNEGIAGAAGTQGPNGTNGNQGIAGPAGSDGDTGLTGSTGPQGNLGDDGFQGTQGPLNQGPQGPTGAQGLPGGAQGFQGPIGFQGNAGSDGSDGTNGLQGNQGNDGSDGTNGLQGFQGNAGSDGSNGLQGNVGIDGLQGNQGSVGDTGLQGPQGNVGIDGVQGFIGFQGFQGADGVTATIYSEDGTIDTTSSLRTVTIEGANGLLFKSSATGFQAEAFISDELIDFRVIDIDGSTSTGFDIDNIDGIRVFDGTNLIGLFYHADYSENGISVKGDGWIPDIRHVKSQISSDIGESVVRTGQSGHLDTARFISVTGATGPVSPTLSISMSHDGFHAFIGANDGVLRQYDLSVQWDIDSAIYTGNTYSPGFSVQSVSFSVDGLKLITNQGGGVVRGADLSAPWDLSTAVTTDSITPSEPTGTLTDVFTSPDGYRLYIYNGAGDTIYQYSMKTPWDLTTLTFVDSQDMGVGSNISCGAFSNDGSILYLSGGGASKVREFTVARPWDITSAFDSGMFYTMSHNLTRGVYVKPDGTGFFTTSNNLGLADVESFSIGLTALGFSSDSITYGDGSTQWQGARPSPFAGRIATSKHVTIFDVSVEDGTPNGLALSTDGLKMYLVGNENDSIFEYDLSTAFDISTAAILQSFDISGEGNNPSGIVFKTDGTKMYVSHSNAQDINEYELSTAWDVTSAEQSSSFDVSGQDSSIFGLSFRPDGLRLYFGGGSNDSIFEVILTIPWDLSTASAGSSFDVSGETITPLGISFSPDGYFMYVLNDDINEDGVEEYQLTTPWDITTAVLSGFFKFKSSGNYRGLHFDSRVGKFYTSEQLNDVILELDMGVLAAGVSQLDSLEANSAWLDDAAIATADGSTITHGTTPNTFNGHIITSTNFQSFSVNTEDTAPTGLFIGDNGRKMYVLGDTGGDVNEYDLSTPYDIGTASINQTLGSLGDSEPLAIFFKPDGLVMYITGGTGQSLMQFSLTTAWDISTATANGTSSTSSFVGSIIPRGLHFHPSGKKYYINDYNSNNVEEFDLSTPWNILTTSYNNVNFAITAGNTGLSFKGDGTIMYSAFEAPDVREYRLESPWDITSAVLVETISLTGLGSTVRGLYVRPDANKFYVVDNTNDDVVEYDMGLLTESDLTIFSGGSTTLSATGAVNIESDATMTLESIGLMVIRSTEGNVTIESVDSNTDVDINSGSGVTTQSGGDVNLNAGDGGATSGAGGHANINAGDGIGSSSGQGGDVNLTPGESTGGFLGGSANIKGGDTDGPANGGRVFIDGGDTTSTSHNGGLVQIKGGDTAATGGGRGSGAVHLLTPDASSNEDSGDVFINPGNVVGGEAGTIIIDGGNTTGSGSASSVNITGGDAHLGTGFAGNVSMVGGFGNATNGPGKATVKGGPGAASGADGGDAILEGGAANGAADGKGGSVEITGGDANLIANGAGGDIDITVGAGNGTGVDGELSLVFPNNTFVWSPDDLSDTTFAAANNQAAPVDVTGFAFANANVRSFRALVSIAIDATADLYEVFTLEAIQRGADWTMSSSSTGDTSNIVFTITNAGQIQYTSGNESGFVSSTIQFRATTTRI